MILPDDSAVRWRRLELVIWAFLLSLAYHPGPFGFMAWLALARPIVIFTRLEGGAAFKAAYFFAFFFNAFTLYWVALVTPPGIFTAVLIVSLYYAIILYAFSRLYQFRAWLGLIALPFLWTGLEYFRTLSEFAFPWSDLGYTQAYYLYILQIVSVISVHGLTWLIVAVNVLVAIVIQSRIAYERRIASGLVAAGVVVMLLGYGWVVTPPYPEPGEFEVALLQGSIPVDVKWSEDSRAYSFDLYDSLTHTVPDSAVGLYIWPETSAPCYMTHDLDCRRRVSRTVDSSDTPHLVGTLAASPVGDKLRHFNSCFQYDSLGHIVRRYDKVKLVPFSEHVPYQDYLPFLEKGFLEKYLTFLDQHGVQWWSDFYPGDSAIMFSVGELNYGVLICFEATFPEYCREYILDGAHFMVGITNDTWFKRSLGVYMHSRIFVTRMVENRCWGARAANSGLTYIVDGYGRIRERLDLYEVAALRGKVGVIYEYSIFTRIGDIAGLVSFLITTGIVGILLALWITRKIRSRRLSA